MTDGRLGARARICWVGAEDVLVNGDVALKDRMAIGAHTGRGVRGRAWTGASGGSCRASAADWTWSYFRGAALHHKWTEAF